MSHTKILSLSKVMILLKNPHHLTLNKFLNFKSYPQTCLQMILLNTL